MMTVLLQDPPKATRDEVGEGKNALENVLSQMFVLEHVDRKIRRNSTTPSRSNVA